MLGTPSSLAVSRYLNDRHVPQVLTNTGSSLLDDPKNLPWTTIYSMSFRTEAWILAAYLLQMAPDAKLGIIYQNDEFGKGFLRFFKQGLGAKAGTMVVKEVSYDITSPTIDSQILQLKSAGVDTVLNSGTPKFAAQAIRKIHEMGWKPLQLVLSASSSLETVLRPAGLEASKDLISTQFQMTPDDPAWVNDPNMISYKAFMKKWAPNENVNDGPAVNGYISSYIMEEILKKCGNDLSRENILRQANSFPETPMPLLIPGVKYNATPENHTPFHEAQPIRFDGEKWLPVSDVIRAVVPSAE
jgi:ABC-type branched-subunit amino acid transport system substrate-binding protein